MSKGFMTPITIIDAINRIVKRELLLPAIQRKFVWRSEQIEMLFDSAMREYPINSFMFWEIDDPNIKNDFQFYEFLTEYREFFKEDNNVFDTKSIPSFSAVIDGQQRLTSLYLGLKGSYAYKMPRKWWKDDETALPTRWLYIELSEELPDEDERGMKYNFKFLSQGDIKDYKESSPDAVWFKVNDILRYGNASDLDNYIDIQSWRENGLAKDIIRRLRRVVFDEKIINYYNETSQDIDVVLDVFIRTNSGGTPLSFSNLLMSMTTAQWKNLDARKEIADVVMQIFGIGSPGFKVDTDFILKCCLFLCSDNIKFKVKNFDSQVISFFEQNWDKIKMSIIETFKMLASWGFNDSSLRSKNAVIPLIYYCYSKGIQNEINNPTKHKVLKETMRKWLCLSLLKQVFGSQSDTVLTKIKKVIEDNLNDPNGFPLDKIKDAFKDSKNDLSFTDDFIYGLLTTQKDSPDCYSILALLYSHLNFGQPLHMDHCHPYSYFKKIKETDFQDEKKYKFYTDKSNYNSILNLQLLNGVLNQSKSDKALKDWVKDNNVDLDVQLIPKGISLDISDFEIFIEERKEMLKNKLLNIV